MFLGKRVERTVEAGCRSLSLAASPLPTNLGDRAPELRYSLVVLVSA